MSGPFAGLRIIDLSTEIAGPYLTMFLSDLGAEVIKVEPPEGDPARDEPGFWVWNRGKRSLRLDVTQGPGADVARRLAEISDVLVESYPPGRAESLGLGYEQLRSANPRLIYCAMPALGSEGPYAQWPGSDTVAAAASGVIGSNPSRAGRPSFVTLPVSSYSAAVLAAQGIAAALYVRQKTGRGQRVEASLLAGALATQSASFVVVPQAGVAPMPGTVMNPLGNLPTYRLFECQDGKWLFIACGNSAFWGKLCIVIGHEELVSDPRYANAPFGITDEQARNYLAALIEGIMKQKPREEWLRLLREGDVPTAPADTVEEFAQDPQVLHNNMMVELEDPRAGAIRQMGLPISFSQTPGQIGGPAPDLGQHSQEILRELGYSADAIAALRASAVI